MAYDQRGHGRSTKPSSGYGFERPTADAAAVIRATGLGRPIVVGHSWGANVALELAVRHPRLVSRGDPAGRGLLIDAGPVRLAHREATPLPAGVRRHPGRVLPGRDPRPGPAPYAGDRKGRPLAGPCRRTRRGPPAPRARQPPEDPPRPVGAGHGRAAAPGPRADARPGGSDTRRRAGPGGLRASEGRRGAARPGDQVAGGVRVDRGDPYVPLQRPEAVARRIAGFARDARTFAGGARRMGGRWRSSS